MKVVISLLIVVLAIVGISDAGYISYNELNDTVATCGIDGSCNLVLSSKYAHILGVPIAYLGLFYYLTVFVLGVINFLEIDLSKLLKIKKSPFRFATAFDLLHIIISFGFIFSLYLVFIMGFVLHDWCRYCLLSATTTFILFGLIWTYKYQFNQQSSLFIKSMWLPVVGWVYKNAIKPMLFQIDAERVHTNFVKFGSILGNNKITGWALSTKLGFVNSANAVEFDGIEFPNRVGLAAGFDYEANLTQAIPQIGFGWHTIGTITYQAYDGNPPPMLGRFPSSKALLVNKGLKNLGARGTIAKLQQLPLHIPTCISISSTNKKFHSDKEQILDILMCFQLFEKSNLSHQLYELNISCPNVYGGEPFTTVQRLEILLTALDCLRISRPVYVKMPIDQGKKETLELLKVADKHNIQGVIFGNLTKDKSNPAVTTLDRKEWRKKQGNLSGKPTYERSNKWIALTKKEFGNRFTIVGTGGIFSPADAQTKFNSGADLVQLITGMIFEGPQLASQINLEMSKKACSGD